jgi:hypothetical protein
MQLADFVEINFIIFTLIILLLLLEIMIKNLHKNKLYIFHISNLYLIFIYL